MFLVMPLFDRSLPAGKDTLRTRPLRRRQRRATGWTPKGPASSQIRPAAFICSIRPKSIVSRGQLATMPPNFF